MISFNERSRDLDYSLDIEEAPIEVKVQRKNTTAMGIANSFKTLFKCAVTPSYRSTAHLQYAARSSWNSSETPSNSPSHSTRQSCR